MPPLLHPHMNESCDLYEPRSIKGAARTTSSCWTKKRQKNKEITVFDRDLSKKTQTPFFRCWDAQLSLSLSVWVFGCLWRSRVPHAKKHQTPFFHCWIFQQLQQWKKAIVGKSNNALLKALDGRVSPMRTWVSRKKKWRGKPWQQSCHVYNLVCTCQRGGALCTCERRGALCTCQRGGALNHDACIYGTWCIPHLPSGNITSPNPLHSHIRNLQVDLCMCVCTCAVWESTLTYATPRPQYICVEFFFNEVQIQYQRIFLKRVQPIAFGVSLNLNLQSQSPWSLFNGTWQKRPRELDYGLKIRDGRNDTPNAIGCTSERTNLHKARDSVCVKTLRCQELQGTRNLIMERAYGIATISRLLQIIGLFCRISYLSWSSFAKETYDFMEPTTFSHPIPVLAFICVIWLLHMCDMTPSYVPPRRSCLLCVTWLNHTCDMTHSDTWHDSFIYVTWLLHVCDMIPACVMIPSYIWHDLFICAIPCFFSDMWRKSFMCVTWLLHMCDMTPSYLWHDVFIYVTWLLHTCERTPSYMWHKSFICVKWLLHIRDMTPSYVWNDSFIYVTWLLHMCDGNLPHMWHDSSICVTWPFHACDVTLSHVWHDSSIHVTWLLHMCLLYVTWFFHVCVVTPPCMWHDSFVCVT